MKLKYNNIYKSIGPEIQECFNHLEFPDLTVITGINGSGKTQLLEAINQGFISIEHDGILNYGPKTFFNYNDFVLQSIAENRRHRTIQHGGGEDETQRVSQKINEFNQRNSLMPYDLIWDVFEKIIEEGVEGGTKFVKNNFENSDIDFAPYTKSDDLFDDILSIYKSENENFWKSAHKPGRRLQESLFNISQESYLGELLFQGYKNYLKHKADFQWDNFEKMTAGWNDWEEEFEEKHGPNPLKLFNEVLKECSCNGYHFDTNQSVDKQFLRMNFGSEDFNKWSVAPTLQKESVDSININDLSSGEQTLLAIASVLSNYTNNQGNSGKVLLLDEVGTNLHPSMAQQFLDVVQNVFIKKYGLKIFLVTHSPSTVALTPGESLFVMHQKEEDKQRIAKVSEKEALAVLTEGFMTFDEGVQSIGQKKDTVYVEGKTDKKYFERACELLGFGNLLSQIEIIDLDGSGKVINNHNSLKEIVKNNPSALPVKHISVVDCDVINTENDDVAGKVFLRKLERMGDCFVDCGIENLFKNEMLEKAWEVDNTLIERKSTSRHEGTDNEEKNTKLGNSKK